MRIVAALSVSAFVSLSSAHATAYYWNTTGTNTWSTGANWSDTSTTGGTTGVVPGAGDTAFFNQSSVSGTETVQVGGAIGVAGITFANTAPTTLQSDSATTRVLTLGTGGITVNSGAGAATVSLTGFVVNISLSGSQSWTNNSSSLLAVKGAITNASTTTPVALTFDGSGSGGTSLNGVISNNTATTKVVINTTGGATTFTNSNTFTGGFILTAGTAVDTVATGLGGGTLTLNGGTLDLETGAGVSINAYSTTVAGNVTIKSGVASGSTGVSHLFGNLSLGAGTLTADKGSNVTSGQRVQFKVTTLTGNTTVDSENNTLFVLGAGGVAGLGGNFNLTVQSAATGNGQVSIRASTNGTRTSGVTTFLSGINNINTAGGIKVLGDTGTTLVLTGGSLDLAVSTSSILAYNTTVNGNFSLTSSSLGVAQTLGTLSIGAFTLTTASTSASGAENLAFGATTLTGNATFNVGNGTAGGSSTLTLGAVGDGGNGFGLTKSGSSTLILNGAGTYSGATTVNAGILRAGTTQAFGINSAVTTNAVLDLNGFNNSIGSLAGSGTVTLGAGTLTTGGTNTSTAFSGVISGAGAFTKVGTSTQTLSGNNSYTGATTVNGGTLLVTGSLAGTTAVTVANSGSKLQLGSDNRIKSTATLTISTGILDTQGYNQTLGSLTSTGASILDLGSGASVLNFADSSAQTWSGTLSIYNWTGTPAVGGGTDQVIFATQGLTQAQLDSISFYSDSGVTLLGTAEWAPTGGSVNEIVAVPEPGTWAMLLGGLGMLVACQRMRRSQRA